jgi:(2Fe-2S) ferredoxin
VVLCRSCCCGSEDKHPDVDHTGQRTALEAGVRRSGGRLVVADCLDACDRSNVVVVRPRGRGTPRPVWLGDVLDEQRTAAVLDWVESGGPGAAALPAVLEPCLFTPSRHNKQELEEV